MSPFLEMLLDDNEGLNLCAKVGSLEVARLERPRSPDYKQADIDIERDRARAIELRRYIAECAARREKNLEAIDSGNYYARVVDIDRVNYLHEVNRVRDFASTGEWTARQFLPGPEPYERVTLEEIDATIEKIENQLTAKGMA